MNAKTLEAIKRHGETLLRAFPNATEKNPVALCKKLRRIENSIAPILLQACNGPEVPEEELNAACSKALRRANELLFGTFIATNGGMSWVFVNRDPRGHALKLNDAWTRGFNLKQYAANLPALLTNWGGCGILAPDLRGQESGQ
jgi:hypothetical protein